MKRHAWAAIAALVVSSSAFAPACGSETEDGNATNDADGSANGDGSNNNNNNGGDSGGSTDGNGGYDGNSYNGTPGQCTPLVAADGTSPQCADCKDNDGDGKIDWLDPECAGPLDNDEATFGTGIPGDNMDACKQDCFFDGNSGAGDDRCEWNLKCDPANTSGVCPYDKNYKNCPATQADQCKKYCAALTPNGCDCFGCCTVEFNGVKKDVRLSSTCSVADINDPAKCAPCTKVADCQNDCGPCELCIGKTTIDPSCTPTPTDGGSGTDSGTPDPLGGQTCSIQGAQACNAQVPCPNGTYCVTGCCIQIVN